MPPFAASSTRSACAVLSEPQGSLADDRLIAERVRDACLQAALQAWEDAGVQGLCAEGRWEAAISAIRSLALPDVPRSLDEGRDGQR